VFAHRLAFEFDSIRVVNQPIQDRVGDRGVGDDLVPLVDRKLAGDESFGRAALAGRITVP